METQITEKQEPPIRMERQITEKQEAPLPE